MTNDLNDHFPHSLRSSHAEVLKTIETIGTIFFFLLAHLAIVLACGGFKDNRDNRDNIFFLACAPCNCTTLEKVEWICTVSLRLVE